MPGARQTAVHRLLQQHWSDAARSARDGYGGGCGGFEVFAFLAFLLALLDLLLDLNDMDEGGARHLRAARSAHGGSPSHCAAELEVEGAAWAAGQVAEGVLRAVASPTASCGHLHLCHAAAAAAARGPLAATLTRLAGEWLERWPGLRGSQLGRAVLSAATTLTCPPDHNCTANTPPTPAHALPTSAHTSWAQSYAHPRPEGVPALLQRLTERRRTDAKH